LFNCILFYYPSGVKGLVLPPFETIVELGYGTVVAAVPSLEEICFFKFGGEFCYYLLVYLVLLFIVLLFVDYGCGITD
jgi:hypothetical protein